MDTEKKTTMTFTARELEILSAALNHYFCDQVDKSATYGNIDSIRAGYKDLYERNCDALSGMQIRTWKAQERINK